MIDFDALVIGPAMNTFAEPFTVFPADGEGDSYSLRGVWSERANDIVVGDELISSGQIRTIGIRLSEVPLVPQQGWTIRRDRGGALYIIDDLDDDGQGGSMMTVKEAE